MSASINLRDVITFQGTCADELQADKLRAMAVWRYAMTDDDVFVFSVTMSLGFERERKVCCDSTG